MFRGTVHISVGRRLKALWMTLLPGDDLCKDSLSHLPDTLRLI